MEAAPTTSASPDAPSPDAPSPEASGVPSLLSGIQPSGTLHIGNYFGAIRQHIANAANTEGRTDAFFFIANYHALTSLRDAERLRQLTFDVALDYLALGFDPTNAHLFVQSDVPEVTELTWVFLTLTPVSQLEKGVSYKDKVAQGLSANGGLLAYPILQAADILAYGDPSAPVLVPVGADQKQNIEIARDLAIRFNNVFAPEAEPILPVPEARIMEEVAIVPGIDGRKMSKSYGNTIPIFEEGKALKKIIMSIVTDSTPLEDPKDPETDNVFALIKLFAGGDEAAEIAESYRAGGYGYGHAKKALLGMVEKQFAEARERRRELAARPDDVWDVLRQGATAAQEAAAATLSRVREATGLATTIR
ncbi:tryptophan--tRNA ligase [Rubricoccus marinus]|uniref:Tryptophan--tRNA ligase n=1 Tax=Rubricoccus marinus TaxID=716817 RepID=A0A259TY50_9BACT|nr:tryptophan--tRNA ligase [Rubricoccus marinus]OZC02620.1 tryptophan--tRNA ligase [Rubricoccus marinus]